MTTPDRDHHGTVYIPCVPLGPITVTRCETTQHGTIASVDLGGVGVHVHTAAKAREGVDAWLKALEILDPDGMAELRQQILGARILELLAEDDPGWPQPDGPTPLRDVSERFAPLHHCGPACEDEPAQVMYAGKPLAEVAEDIPVPFALVHVCSDCGTADPVRVNADGKCWNTRRCDERQAANAGYGTGGAM